MKPYIFGARNGIYIIDLQQTVKMFRTAHDFVKDTAGKGKKVLFVGTKKQAQNSIEQAAKKCGMDYVNHRWIGGLLTNFSTVKNGIGRLNKLDAMKASPELFSGMTKKEALVLERERLRLEKNLGGLRTMAALPAAIFVIDSKKETIAIREARKIGIPVVAVVDTNCDPDELDYIIPGNDDAIRAIDLFANTVAEACLEGRAAYGQAREKEAEKIKEAEGIAQKKEAAPVMFKEAAQTPSSGKVGIGEEKIEEPAGS